MTAAVMHEYDVDAEPIADLVRAKVMIAITDSEGRMVQLFAAPDGRSAAAHIMRLQREWGPGYTVGGFAFGDFLSVHLRQFAAWLDQAPLADGAQRPGEYDRGVKAGRVSVAKDLRALADRWKGWQP